jgi:hypothetical protein
VTSAASLARCIWLLRRLLLLLHECGGGGMSAADAADSHWTGPGGVYDETNGVGLSYHTVVIVGWGSDSGDAVRSAGAL